ncbi:UNVERIFIED_CONTAM: hypothetical protein K2H54_022216 [Gekko kuhli]
MKGVCKLFRFFTSCYLEGDVLEERLPFSSAEFQVERGLSHHPLPAVLPLEVLKTEPKHSSAFSPTCKFRVQDGQEDDTQFSCHPAEGSRERNDFHPHHLSLSPSPRLSLSLSLCSLKSLIN